MDVYKMENFLQKLPKIELHAHLNGSLGLNTLRELGELLYGGNATEFTELDKQLIAFDSATNFHDCFEKFKIVHNLTATRCGLKLAAELVIRDFAKDNVIYLELRTTPKENAHMTRCEYLECVLAAIKNARATYPSIHVKLLPSIDRSQPVLAAQQIVDLALEYHQREPKLVPGMDFSGNPHNGCFADFKPLLKRALNAGLKLTMHCAEIDNPTEIAEMLEFGMSRCGHGTFLNDAQIAQLKAADVVIECCLTSNVKSSTVPSYSDHHLKRILQAKGHTVLCTDDCGVFGTTLTQEFQIASETFRLDKLRCFMLTTEAIRHAFATDAEKLNLLRRVLSSVTEIEAIDE